MADKSNFQHLLVALCFLFISVSCAQNRPSEHAYKTYPGKALPDSEIATLSFGERVEEFFVDGVKIERTDYGFVKLEPGVHQIKWKYRFAVSVLVNSSGWDEIEATTSIDFQAGHTYSVNAARTTGHGYHMILWISDETSGKQIFKKEI